MTTERSLIDVLSSFTAASESALQGLPEPTLLSPTENGITLLDTKNEIFLAYLQALALRNLNVVRALRDGSDFRDVQQLSNEITQKLIEHRVYLERGVRPLEQKIKYQVDKVVKAADDSARDRDQNPKKAGKTKTSGRRSADGSSRSSASDSDEESSASDSSSDDEMDQGAHRTVAANFVKPKSSESLNGRRERNGDDAVYRPPRISATAMPTTEQRERKERRPARSATLDEYVSTELSNAPVAQPSIGSTIEAGGRRHKNARQMAKEQEKRDYEETNLVRLPKESKKERAKQAARERERSGFGGEEWRELDMSVDRIGNLTRKKGKDSALEKSRKRRATEDGARGDGVGDAFELKKRKMMRNMRR